MPTDTNQPRDVNPRDPKGAVGSTLNPLRDHVQGEPEGGDKGEAASPPASPPPAPHPAQPQHHEPAKKR